MLLANPIPSRTSPLRTADYALNEFAATDYSDCMGEGRSYPLGVDLIHRVEELGVAMSHPAV